MYVWDKVAVKGGRSRRGAKPFAIHSDCYDDDEEDRKVKDEAKASPVLHLFMRANKFDKAIIAADGARFIVHGSMEISILVFISIFTVFFVGYPEGSRMFLGFLQTVILGEEYTAKRNIGYTELLSAFSEAKACVLKTYAGMQDRGVLKEGV